jgi:hypothetical protein
MMEPTHWGGFLHPPRATTCRNAMFHWYADEEELFRYVFRVVLRRMQRAAGGRVDITSATKVARQVTRILMQRTRGLK